ncbi:MAG: D-alanyl-D-alanine carboxypeptidase/D-alanyl-D-alanine-endopeptidase [Candidatus Delongbacteria bacterium]|jgi:D-alanyl-D-alanine carboxypeptidase/D-alanyl-D-alanine-endopeptidase (penicillin-binding protein 4)|nr:D-alanyl-D-alanine carboxypeptidase/D-alanyl-D-alanine-endopeptidase [Candidatus Delongbacteria bacterium]
MIKRTIILIAIATFLLSCSKTIIKDEIKEKLSTIQYKDIDASELPMEFNVLSDTRSGMWSVMFYDLDNNISLFEYNQNKNLLPASNLKIVTTAAALKVLGPFYQFRTDFFYTGKINKKLNLLDGDIIVYGSGDPTIGQDYFRDSTLTEFQVIADSLKKNLGIDYIRGNIKVYNPVKHDNMFGKGWDVDDLPHYYSAIISPIAFNENLIKIIIKDGKINALPDYPFKFKLDTIPDMERSNFTRILGTDSVIVRSNFEKRVQGYITVQDPEKNFINALERYLKKNDISVMHEEIQDSTISIAPLCTIYSDSLLSIAHKCNIESNNFYAEQLFRETAKIFSADNLVSDSLRNIDLSYGNILKLNSELYSRLFGINNFEVMDGSGLSRRNFFSAEKFIKVLKLMKKDRNFVTYLSSFPNPGKDGTLEFKFVHPDLNNVLFAKSGSMSGVNDFTGYLITKKGTRIAFSILNNYYNFSRGIVNRKLEKMLVYVVNNY